MSNKLGSYGKIYNLGHRAVRDLLNFPVQVQEKIDGSQFSFGVRNSVLNMRSKRAVVHVGDEPGQFKLASETVQALFADNMLEEGWTYRGEAVTKPRHNHLVYDRIPVGGIILFDIDRGEEDMADYDWLRDEAERLGLEVVPQFGAWVIENVEDLAALCDRKSILGGESNIEGIVIKPIGLIFDTLTGKTLRAKVVAPEYRETQTTSWKSANPNRNDFINAIVAGLATEARWRKAIQALRDAGELDNSPKDIGPLLKQISQDILEEEGEAIAAALLKHFWKKNISRGVTRGFPQFYTEYLIGLQFDDPTEEEE